MLFGVSGASEIKLHVLGNAEQAEKEPIETNALVVFTVFTLHFFHMVCVIVNPLICPPPL